MGVFGRSFGEGALAVGEGIVGEGASAVGEGIVGEGAFGRE